MSSTRDIKVGDIVWLKSRVRKATCKSKVQVLSIKGDKIISTMVGIGGTIIADYWMYEPIFNEQEKVKL